MTIEIVGRLHGVAVSIGMEWTAEHRQHVFDTVNEAALTIESLVKALEPFAKIASSEITGGDPFQYYWVVIGAPGRVSFTDEDLRRARAEITKLRGGS